MYAAEAERQSFKSCEELRTWEHAACEEHREELQELQERMRRACQEHQLRRGGEDQLQELRETVRNCQAHLYALEGKMYADQWGVDIYNHGDLMQQTNAQSNVQPCTAWDGMDSDQTSQGIVPACNRPARSPTHRPPWTCKADTKTPSDLSKTGQKHDSMRKFLEDLWDEDTRCVIFARGIRQLSFRSKYILEQHFSQYGEISCVFAPHSKTKGQLRPGNLAVIVMRAPESVESILAHGLEQWIEGVRVEVSQYERPSSTQADLPQPEAETGSQDELQYVDDIIKEDDIIKKVWYHGECLTVLSL